MRFEIRRKEFPYSEAPILDGVNAGYKALTVDEFGKILVISRHAKAIDAAIAAATEAHRLNHSTSMGTRAAVQGFWTGERPAGVMKQPMHVSYRVRD